VLYWSSHPARIRNQHTNYLQQVLHRHREVLFMSNLETELPKMSKTDMETWLYANEAAMRSSAKQSIENSLANVRSLSYYFQRQQTPTRTKPKNKHHRTQQEPVHKVMRSRKRQQAQTRSRKITLYLNIQSTRSRRSQSTSPPHDTSPEQRRYRQLTLLSNNASTAPGIRAPSPTLRRE